MTMSRTGRTASLMNELNDMLIHARVGGGNLTSGPHAPDLIAPPRVVPGSARRSRNRSYDARPELVSCY
jgi:hypothetical protein